MYHNLFPKDRQLMLNTDGCKLLILTFKNNTMNIYLVSQGKWDDRYDYFDSMVVYAESGQIAKEYTMEMYNNKWSDWVDDINLLTAEYIGTNEEIKEKFIIISSFNAS